MIQFELQNVYQSADWVSVTIDMAPDEIEYVISTGENRVKQQDPLTKIIALYICVASSGSSPACDLAAFNMKQTDNYIHFEKRTFSESIETTATMSELKSAMEPFLTEVFEILDSQSSSQEREKAFEFLNGELQASINQIYNELTK